jgi:hypothetical protein
LNNTSIQTQRAHAGKELSFGTVHKTIGTLSTPNSHIFLFFGSGSFLFCVTAYLDLSATCTPGQVAPAQCKCYFELDFRKMTVAEVKRQFGNFVSASGAAHVPRVPKISSFLAANKVVARAASAQP